MTAIREEQIDLRDLIEQVLRRRWLISLMVLIGGGAALVVALVWPRTYDATVVLMPAPDQSGGLSGAGLSLGSRLGGLASLAGLGGSGSAKEAESMAVLESASLARKFVEEKNLLPILFEGSWDAGKQQWKPAKSGAVPSLWLGGEYFSGKVRSIERSSSSGLVRVGVRWKDPHTAAAWANDLVALANRYMRDKAIEEAERNIAYLTGESQKTGVVEVRQAIFSLLEGELNKAMLARGSDEYAFRVIDPATAPDSPSVPSWKLLVLAGALAGAIFGVFLALLQLAWQRPSARVA